MCQFCSQSNEQMESNDNELSRCTREEHIDSASSQAVNNEQGTVQKDASSSGVEASRSTLLSSSESLASNSSEYSVDVNPYDDGHSKEDGGGFEGGQEDPRPRLYGTLDTSHGLTENQKLEKNGLFVESSSSDDSSNEEDEPSLIVYEREDIWVPPEPENKNDDEENSMTNMDDDNDEEVEECANVDSSEWEMPRLKERKIESKKVKDGKFKDLVSQLLQKLSVDISGVKEENWVDIITDLAWKAAKYLEPGVPEGKAIDPAGSVKIKCVPAGLRSESRLIKGLVFKKHAAHKHMITKYQNPKLLLIQGMLGPSSGSSGLSSLDSMIKADEANCEDLIKRLQACQPNVILVEKSASRVVMESILKVGITLVLDMKPDRLERVARCTGSTIVSSDATFSHKLRHCQSLYFEKLEEEHSIVGEGVKKPSKTLMFLEGCPTNLGCTILLKGSHAEELKKIKCVVQCAVVMAYHFLLETSFLVDQKAMFSTIAAENASDILSTNEQSPSVVSEKTYIPHNGESNVDALSADGVQVCISDGRDQEPLYLQKEKSCHVKELTAEEAKFCHDITASNRPQEEKSCHVQQLTAKDAKNTETTSSNGFHDEVSDSPSTVCYEPHFTTVSGSARSLSHALVNVSIVSPDTYKEMSTYIDMNGKEPDVQTAVTIPVLPTEDTAELCDTEAKNNSQSVLTSSVAVGEANGAADDGEENIRPKDQISSVLDSESILVLMSSRNASKGTICEQSHFTHIKFYRNFDVPLGKFLLDNLFNQALKCNECGELPEAHYYYYAHHSKQLTIHVKRLYDKKPLPRESDGKIWMWSRCSKCEPEKGKATKRVLISTAARCLSFGKFLELSFSSLSSFNRPASCGHSFQKDFLYFFGLGPMVAMFQYSRVAIHNISLPPHKMEFSSSLQKDWLEPETRIVYTTGLVLFNELEKYLKKIESRFSGWNLMLNGFSKGYSDIVDLLKFERSEFEENFNKKNEDSLDSVCNLLSLNRLRWEILLEACVWDRRLQSLLSSSSPLLQFTDTENGLVQRQLGLKDDAGQRLKTEAELVNKQQIEEHKSGSESEQTKKVTDEAVLDHSNGTVDPTAQVIISPTELNESAGEPGLQRAEDDGLHNVAVKVEEGNSHSDDMTSDNCNDAVVPIEMVAEAGNLSIKKSPYNGSLPRHGEQDMTGLPVLEENTRRTATWDSIPSFNESNGNTHLPSHLCSDSESTQQDNVSSSSHLLENRSISIRTDEENSNHSGDGEAGEASERKACPPLLKLDSSLWNPFRQIREEYMDDLLAGRPPKFGHLPKFELLHSPDFLPTVSKVIMEEGSRLHIPLSYGDFIVSDFDGEISSLVACALARTENSPHSASENDENTTLKRAASEPWPLSSAHDPNHFHPQLSMILTESQSSHFDSSSRLDSVVSYGREMKEVILGTEKYPLKGKYSVAIIYPNEFRNLRHRCCPSELDYIASISRCKNWDAKGGKSKSFFAKTLDERLIIKEIKKTEFDSFMKFAPEYFAHMTVSVDSGNQTCLAKILGLYQVTIRHPKSGKETKHDLMVQENLSFGRKIFRHYDLKGALRARFNETADGEGEVLLDANFVKDMKSSPLYIVQRAKRLLQRAVWNDTTFLNNIGVMDYSLLVGVDRQRRELVCGIIDYLRQYTWDKQFETWVKASLAPKSDRPTIISPQDYKKRFRKFMDTHFLTVPNDWCLHRPSNPCKLCGAKVYDSSAAKLEKREEELKDVQVLD